MDLQIIIPLLRDKIENYAKSQKELSYLLEDVQKKAKQNLRKDDSEKLLKQICSVEDTIDSIIATKMLQRQNISIEKVPVKYFVSAIRSAKFRRVLHRRTKELKDSFSTMYQTKQKDFLSLQVPEEKLRSNSDTAEAPAKKSSSNTDPQKKSSKGDAVVSKSISEGIQVSSENKYVGKDSSELKDSDESYHQSWEEGSVPVVLEELGSRLAQPELLSRRMRQLHILKTNLECPSDAILLWTSYHSYDTKQNFQFRCWVLVSEKSGEGNILSYILKQVPSIKKEELEKLELSNLRKRLQNFLVFNRYLIVLYGELRDDVWNNLKSAFPYSLNGSRVLLISRGITSISVSKEWSCQQRGKSKDYFLEECRILGMKHIMTELSQSILNKCKLLFLISIVGVAESEKTTFLWAMYNAGDVKQLFQYHAWVRVPKEFKEEDLLADILEQVTDNKVEDKDPVSLKKKLCSFLAPKRYLIVLYGVWKADIWDKLKQAFPNSMNGSRVILTVHQASVARQTNCSWIFGTVCGKELLREKVSNPKLKHKWDIKANESGLVGLDDKVKELAELLHDNYQFLISVVGVAGSGKTMLVKAIYNSLAIKQHFDCRAFVSVSQVYEDKKLLADLSMQLGMVRKDESWPLEELQRRLKIFLAWKRYLIVLDDVHEADVWGKLSLAFPNSSNGSRVILTTRDACVPRHVNPHARVIQQRLLNDDESWELFANKVQEVGKNAELKAFKEKILQSCGGLPLDIVVLGGLLSTKESVQAWSEVIKQVNQMKERRKRGTGEDGLNSSSQPASSYMKQETVNNFITDQSNPFTRHDSSDTKLAETDGRDGKEIEETSLNEAQPIQEEGKLKHAATDEDQENFSNKLTASDMNQKEDNKTLEMQNTSFDQDQSGSSDEALSAILALGYQDLNSHLKFCLNYLGLFPKSYKVPFRRLFQLLQAEGLLKQETREESFEEQVKKYIEDLKKRNMIEVEKQKLNGSPKTVCMQSYIYDVLSERAKKDGLFHTCLINGQGTSEQPKFIRRFAEHQVVNNDKLLECSFQLRSYISFKMEKGDRPAFGVDKLLKEIVKGGFGLIVILDLESIYKPVLSKHLGKFPNLKYLGLRWTFLDSIPDSVGDLPCLQTLDVKHTNISTLPGTLWKAKYLQHLYMNNISFDTCISRPFQTNGSLTNLQTLLGLVIRNKNSVTYLRAAEMYGLRKLGVKCYEESIEVIGDWISELRKLQSLKLRSINKSDQPLPLKSVDFSRLNELLQLYLFGKLPEAFDFGTFPSSLEILTLSVSKLSKDPMEDLQALVNLKILRLHARSYIGKTMTCRPRIFPKLQILKLWMLVDLEEWKVEEGAMLALEEVEIRCCMQLNKPSGLEKLTNLKELVLTSMTEKFVKDVKESMGSNVTITVHNWKFSSSWEE